MCVIADKIIYDSIEIPDTFWSTECHSKQTDTIKQNYIHIKRKKKYFYTRFNLNGQQLLKITFEMSPRVHFFSRLSEKSMRFLVNYMYTCKIPKFNKSSDIIMD